MKALLAITIGVYQDTIGKTFKEYLVNFDYFTQGHGKLWISYVIEDMDAKDMGLPSGTGLFKELFDVLRTQSESDPKLKKDIGTALYMTQHEKESIIPEPILSFSERMRDVNTPMNYSTPLQTSSDEQSGEERKDSQEACPISWCRAEKCLKSK